MSKAAKQKEEQPSWAAQIKKAKERTRPPHYPKSAQPPTPAAAPAAGSAKAKK